MILQSGDSIECDERLLPFPEGQGVVTENLHSLFASPKVTSALCPKCSEGESAMGISQGEETVILVGEWQKLASGLQR